MWFINPGAKLMLFHKTHFVICTQKFIVCFILHKKLCFIKKQGSFLLFRLGSYAAGCAQCCQDGRSHRCNDLYNELDRFFLSHGINV